MGTNRTAKAALFLLIILCVACQGTPTIYRDAEWATPKCLCGLDNLFEVVPGKLYRSAKIVNMAGVTNLGIKTVVNLRDHLEGPDDPPPPGVCNIWLPLNASAVEEKDVIEFLQIARDPNRQPVLVHCVHGSDRTGVMVAAYRMVVQNWCAKEAIDEMVHGNYHFHTIFENLPELLERMNVPRICQASLSPFVPKTWQECCNPVKGTKLKEQCGCTR